MEFYTIFFLLMVLIQIYFIYHRKERNAQLKFFYLKGVEEGKFYLGDHILCLALYIPYFLTSSEVSAKSIFISMMCIKLLHEVWVGCGMEAVDDMCVLKVYLNRIQVNRDYLHVF